MDAHFFKSQGMSAIFLRDKFGFSPAVPRELGFKASEVLRAGSSPLGLVQAGYKAADLREAGVEVRMISVLGVKKLLEIGFTMHEIKESGVQATTIKKSLGKLEE